MIVYTAAMGRPVAKQPRYPGVQWIAFCNDPVPKGWERLPLPFHRDDCRSAKAPKILPWDFLPKGWTRALWIDANLVLRRDPKTLRAAFAVHRHRHRDCIYHEAMECIRLQKDCAATITEQVDRYSLARHAAHGGLWECGVLYRENRPEVEALHRDWWAEIETGSCRDQISLPVVERRHNVKITSLGNSVWRSGWVRRG